MPVVTIKPSGKTVEIPEGVNLLEAVVTAGEAIGHKCQGRGECCDCHVFVLEGRKGISRVGPVENAKLDTLVGIGSKSRLACQATVGSDDVTIEVVSFASGG